jgi:hypothetical protein
VAPPPQKENGDIVLDEEGHLTKMVNNRPTISEGTVPPQMFMGSEGFFIHADYANK